MGNAKITRCHGARGLKRDLRPQLIDATGRQSEASHAFLEIFLPTPMGLSLDCQQETIIRCLLPLRTIAR
jgi:hypothetical protein